MNSSTRTTERGTSLVEVLVVMVVLVVGIFTVIRIFPVGFDILQYTGNSSVAHRLAQGEAEYWRKNVANLPDGIVPIDPGPSGIVVDSTVRPTDFLSGTGAFGDNDPQLRDTIATALQRQTGRAPSDEEIDRWVGPNRARRVIGETTPIPVPSPIDGLGVGSVYFLAYAPIEWPATPVNDATIAEQYLQIRGNSFTSVDVTGMPPAALAAAVSSLTPTQFGIDYDKGLVYFPPADHPRLFVARYGYNAATGAQTVLSDPLVVPAAPRNVPLDKTGVRLGVVSQGSSAVDSGFRGVIAGTESVAPKFRYLPAGRPFSADPYEYKMLSSYGVGVQFTGGIVFNPRGYNMTATGPGGTPVPLQAKIDYTVRDWRILHQDVTLPATPPFRVALALPFLKQAGQTSAENTLEPWPGIAGSGNQAYSVVAVDLANGNLAVNNIASGNSFDVDYKNGLLFFPPGASARGVNLPVFSPQGVSGAIDPAGRTFRIFYSVEGDWAVVPQKAYSTYAVLDPSRVFSGGTGLGGGGTNALPIGACVVLPGARQDGNQRFVEVVFPTADEGKAVSYDFTYRNGNGQLRTVYGQGQQITSEARQTGLESWYYKVAPASVTEAPKPYIKIYLPPDQAVRNSSFPNDFVLSQVNGTSFRAVTAWRDRSRWRQEAVNTYLNRSSAL